MEVIEGMLTCPKCWASHPIRKGVPSARTVAQSLTDPLCPFCGSQVEPEYAKDLWDWFEERISRIISETPLDSDPFGPLVFTKPWHCIQQAIHAEYPKLALKLYLRLQIDRIAKERGISRRAASNWLRRHKFNLPVKSE